MVQSVKIEESFKKDRPPGAQAYNWVCMEVTPVK